MARLNASARDALPQPASPTREAVSETRFDGPHVLGAGPVETPLKGVDDAPDLVSHLNGKDESPHPLHTQARQLAAHLRRQKAELDRREAELHRQLATHEQDQRNARQWLEGQQENLTGREERVAAREARLAELQSQWDEQSSSRADRANEQFTERQRALDEQHLAREEHYREQLARLERSVSDLDGRESAQCGQAAIPVADGDLARRVESLIDRLIHEVRAMHVARQELAAQRAALASDRDRHEQAIVASREQSLRCVRGAHAKLERHRAALECRAAEIDAQAGEYARRCREPSPFEQERITGLDERESKLVERARQLDEADQRLEAEQSEMSRLRRDLLAERERLAAQAHLDRRRLADWQQQYDAQWRERSEALERQAETIDLRRATLEQEHHEIVQLHRETLELRLATEELWAQLTGTASAETLAQSLSQTRQRLTDHYRFETTAIDRQRQELDALRESLLDQHSKIDEQTRQLRDWVAARQTEIERQAARLVAREQELDDEQRRHLNEQVRWHDERLELQREIRHLLVQAHHKTSLFAA